MKKLFITLVAALLTVSVSAQKKEVVTAHKTFDNWYLGINAGAATPMQKWGNTGFMKGVAPSAGLRLGKNFTTSFGVAIDANAYFESTEKSLMKTRTFVDAINIDALGTFNVSNFFGGYLGKPRRVELIALGGFGWSHQFGALTRANGINSKAALDLAFNLGNSRAVQLYLEPAVIFGLWDNGRVTNALSNPHSHLKFDSRSGLFQVNVGVNYKFGTSNGTHNFAFAQLRDQGEIDDLNARINELRDENDRKDSRIARDIRRISELEDSLEAARNVKPTVVKNVVTRVVNNNVLQPTVIFGQGKSTIDAAQMASVAMIAKYMKNHPESKILIKGYASPEGNPELNQKLSEARANSVKNALVSRYGIAASRLTTQGMGATDELFDEVDFNRVATFTDTTK
jgi:outer membrane protein OmpA-like peptidoglycan-associated protein